MNLFIKKHWPQHLFLLLLIAFSPLQSAFAANPFEIKVVPNTIVGAAAYEVIVIQNLT